MHMFLLDSLSAVNVFQNLGKHHEVKQKTMIQHVFQSQGCYIFDQYWANTIKYNKLATSCVPLPFFQTKNYIETTTMLFLKIFVFYTFHVKKLLS